MRPFRRRCAEKVGWHAPEPEFDPPPYDVTPLERIQDAAHSEPNLSSPGVAGETGATPSTFPPMEEKKLSWAEEVEEELRREEEAKQRQEQERVRLEAEEKLEHERIMNESADQWLAFMGQMPRPSRHHGWVGSFRDCHPPEEEEDEEEVLVEVRSGERGEDEKKKEEKKKGEVPLPGPSGEQAKKDMGPQTPKPILRRPHAAPPHQLLPATITGAIPKEKEEKKKERTRRVVIVEERKGAVVIEEVEEKMEEESEEARESRRAVVKLDSLVGQGKL